MLVHVFAIKRARQLTDVELRKGQRVLICSFFVSLASQDRQGKAVTVVGVAVGRALLGNREDHSRGPGCWLHGRLSPCQSSSPLGGKKIHINKLLIQISICSSPHRWL